MQLLLTKNQVDRPSAKIGRPSASISNDLEYLTPETKEYLTQSLCRHQWLRRTEDTQIKRSSSIRKMLEITNNLDHTRLRKCFGIISIGENSMALLTPLNVSVKRGDSCHLYLRVFPTEIEITTKRIVKSSLKLSYGYETVKFD